MKTGILYLIPNTLGKTPENNTIPEYTMNILRNLDVLFVENIHNATRYLQWVGENRPVYEIDFYPLNKLTPERDMLSYLEPLKKGRNGGILTDAGAPGIADPGSMLVKVAHMQGIQVVPLVGPSSILLGLMASGFNGQSFAFHGYLPIDERKRDGMIQQLEGESARHDRTQLFIEAPYRNNALLKAILKTTNMETRLCVAADLTLPTEYICTKTVREWKRDPLPELNNRPALFLIYAR